MLSFHYDLSENLSVTNKTFMLSVYTQHNDTQHNGRVLLCWVSFTLSVTNKPFLLSVLMLNVRKLSVIKLSVVMLNVMAPQESPHICPSQRSASLTLTSLMPSFVHPFLVIVFSCWMYNINYPRNACLLCLYYLTK
jgi:hypothetical protein